MLDFIEIMDSGISMTIGAWIAVSLLGIGFLFGMIQSIYYIKLSWINKSNSRNETGLQFAEKVLETNLKSDIKVQAGTLRLRYVRYTVGTKKITLGAFVSKRKSLWTLADATRQAFAADIIERNANGQKAECPSWIFNILAPIPQFLLSFVATMVAGLMLYGAFIDSSFGDFLAYGAASILFLILISYSFATWKAASIMNKNSDKILGNLLTEKEKKQIITLYRIQALAAMITLIINVLVYIVQLVSIIQEEKK